ncbi:hypothetical protein lerEdw1_015779 [Lerista edwardsae]|nr:hypothetical protein lerEdw1_015779 [Lerista edwardsae]
MQGPIIFPSTSSSLAQYLYRKGTVMSNSNSLASDHEVEKSGSPGEVIPYSESEVVRRRDTTADDEFFHFVVFCFAFGTLLVSFYKYNNWTVSLGIGLMTFAALETTGIYFNLVHRIRHVLESLLPLLPTVKIPGFRKVQ